MFKKILMLLSCSFLTTSIPGTLRAMHDATIYDAFGNIFEQIYPELIIGSKDIQTTKAETPQGKITSSEIFGYLERNISLARQLPTETKYVIKRYCASAENKTDYLFKNFKVRSLDEFICPGAQYIKAAFVDPDKLMLIMEKRGDGVLDSDPPNDIVLINVATFKSRTLAENVRFKEHFKNPHLFFHKEQPLLFLAHPIAGNRCHNLASGEVTNLPGNKIAGFSDNKEYLLLNNYRQKELHFFNPQTRAIKVSEERCLLGSLKMGYHPNKKYIAHKVKSGCVNFVSIEESLHMHMELETFWDGIRAIDFNKAGNLLACKTDRQLSIWDIEQKKELHSEKFQKASPFLAAHGMKFLDDSLIIMDNGSLFDVNNFKQLEDNSLNGLRYKTNKEGLVAFTKRGESVNQYLAEYIPDKPSKKDIAQLTLKQKHFIELLSALELTYQDKVKELKAQDPEKNSTTVRINTLLSKIPERVKGFTHDDIQQTWQSLVHMQTYLKKRFNVIE